MAGLRDTGRSPGYDDHRLRHKDWPIPA